MKTYQIDCSKFCGVVTINENNIIQEDGSMRFIKKFYGQPLSNLTAWATKHFGSVTLKEIK